MNFEKAIPEIEKKIDYTFKDKSLLRQAFTRTSFCHEQKSARGVALQSNEVLEFFGDGILSAVIITFFISNCTKRYENGIKTRLDEGEFTNIKSRLSDKKNLSRCMRSLGIQKYLLMGEGDEKLGIENEPSVMEDLFESIIGAVYIDCGMKLDVVMNTATRMLDIEGYISSPETEASAKNLLQEWCADKRRRLPQPRYETLSEEGPEHKRVYERACYIGERLVGVAKGKNRKQADALAAAVALERLTDEEKAAGSTTDSDEPVKKLREFAARAKKPYPTFRDLGEVGASGVGALFAVECRYEGYSETAEGYSKREARARAAEKMLTALHKKTSEKKNTPRNGGTAQRTEKNRRADKGAPNGKKKTK